MSRTRIRGRMLAAVAAIAAVALLSGCTSDPLADQYKEGSNKGYVAGDGSVLEIAEADRAEAVSFEGLDETGATVSSADFEGDIIVVNFWYATCGPCRVEAPTLEELNAAYADKGVTFIGVNLRDQAATAISFAESYGVTYHSIMDADTGAVKLAFSETVPPNSTPSTIVLDKKGRVASRILGPVAEKSILDTLIRDTLAEK